MQLKRKQGIPLMSTTYRPKFLKATYIELNDFHKRSGEFSMDNVEVVEIDLLPLSISLNHWLPGSHVLSLLKHLQALVTMMLLSSTSRHKLEPSLSLDERCMFESEIISHLELASEHVMLSVAGFPSCSACMQKFVLFINRVFWGVYVQASEEEQGPNVSDVSCDLLMTQRPVKGWNISLYALPSMMPGPAQWQNNEVTH